MRVPQYLADQHVRFETLAHPPAFTAQRRAHFLRIPGRHVIKSVVLMSGRGAVLAVLPATKHVDLAKAAAALAADVRLATEDELIDVFRDCERGALTPFGSLYGLTTLLDDGVLADDLIAFEAQRHGLAIRMRCRDYELLEHPRRVALAADPHCVRLQRRRADHGAL
jgi:Ala-tRNA(Pro) deacylase